MTTDLPNSVRLLADRFNEVPQGEQVTLDQLSETIGQDVRKVRWLIYHAQKVIEGETGAKFKTVYKVGYQRLHNHELVKIGQSARKHIRGTSRRAMRGMSAGARSANDLTPDQLKALMREQSALGLLETFAKDRNLPMVDDDARNPLTPGQAARQFLVNLGAIKPEINNDREP